MRTIPLTQGFFAIVNDEKYDELSQYKWCGRKINNTCYAYRHEGKKTIFMHRQILNTPKGKLTDHKNRNGLDNRIENLRICNHSQNAMNSGLMDRNTSGYRGVYWAKDHDDWRARIFCNNVWIQLGHFDSKEDAARAYDKKAIELFGEFARLNFPKETNKQSTANEGGGMVNAR